MRPQSAGDKHRILSCISPKNNEIVASRTIFYPISLACRPATRVCLIPWLSQCHISCHGLNPSFPHLALACLDSPAVSPRERGARPRLQFAPGPRAPAPASCRIAHLSVQHSAQPQHDPPSIPGPFSTGLSLTHLLNHAVTQSYAVAACGEKVGSENVSRQAISSKPKSFIPNYQYRLTSLPPYASHQLINCRLQSSKNKRSGMEWVRRRSSSEMATLVGFDPIGTQPGSHGIDQKNGSRTNDAEGVYV